MAGAISAKGILQGDKTRVHTFAADQNVGDIVALSDRCGITTGANIDQSEDAQGQVLIEGIFQITKAASDGGWSDGDRLYWLPTADVLTPTPVLTCWFVGFAYGDADTADTTGYVSLAPFSAEGGRQITLAATGAQALVKADVTSGRVSVIAPITANVTLTLPPIADSPDACLISVQNATTGSDTLAVVGTETLIGATGTMDAHDDNVLVIKADTAFMRLGGVVA